MMQRLFRNHFWSSIAACVIAWSVATSASAQLSADSIEGIPTSLAALQAGRLSAFSGLTVIDGDPYWRLDLRPELGFGRLRFGLKTVLLVGQPTVDGEKTTKILTEDGEEWNTLGAYLRAIRYVQWAHPRAPLYARYGELFDVRIGHGLLMEGYANLDRRGLRFNVNRPGWGLESMLNNLDAPALFGGRIYVKPLALIGNETPVLRNLTLGVTYLTDTNPLPDGDGYTDEDPIVGIAGDIALPLISSASVLLELYDEFASISLPVLPTVGGLAGRDLMAGERGGLVMAPSQAAAPEMESRVGNAVGIAFHISRLRSKLEYRTFEAGFVPTLFAYDYEYRARTPGQGNFLPPATDGPTKGFYGSAALSFGEQVFLSALFEDYDGEGPLGEPRLGVRLVETTLIEPLDVKMFYTKRGIGGVNDRGEKESFFADLFDLDEKSLFVVQIAYNLTGPLQVILTREYRFREVFDEEGSSLGFQPIKKTTAQIGVNLDF